MSLKRLSESGVGGQDANPTSEVQGVPIAIKGYERVEVDGRQSLIIILWDDTRVWASGRVLMDQIPKHFQQNPDDLLAVKLDKATPRKGGNAYWVMQELDDDEYNLINEMVGDEPVETVVPNDEIAF